MLEFDDAGQGFRVRRAYGTNAKLLERLRRTRIDLQSTLVGRAAIEGRSLQVPDLCGAPLHAHRQLLHDARWRSLIAVPMLREGRIAGALVVRRRTPGGFFEETSELLETFASQSAMAILSARLFRELERKSAELEMASLHKSEFLASMSHELRAPHKCGDPTLLVDLVRRATRTHATSATEAPWPNAGSSSSRTTSGT